MDGVSTRMLDQFAKELTSLAQRTGIGIESLPDGTTVLRELLPIKGGSSWYLQGSPIAIVYWLHDRYRVRSAQGRS